MASLDQIEDAIYDTIMYVEGQNYTPEDARNLAHEIIKGLQDKKILKPNKPNPKEDDGPPPITDPMSRGQYEAVQEWMKKQGITPVGHQHRLNDPPGVTTHIMACTNPNCKRDFGHPGPCKPGNMQGASIHGQVFDEAAIQRAALQGAEDAVRPDFSKIHNEIKLDNIKINNDPPKEILELLSRKYEESRRRMREQ